MIARLEHPASPRRGCVGSAGVGAVSIELDRQTGSTSVTSTAESKMYDRFESAKVRFPDRGRRFPKHVERARRSVAGNSCRISKHRIPVGVGEFASHPISGCHLVRDKEKAIAAALRSEAPTRFALRPLRAAVKSTDAVSGMSRTCVSPIYRHQLPAAISTFQKQTGKLNRQPVRARFRAAWNSMLSGD